MTTIDTIAECQECEHMWFTAEVQESARLWERCPECNADDGENCWDCGVPTEESFMGYNMCSSCRSTVCPDCEHTHICGTERVL